MAGARGGGQDRAVLAGFLRAAVPGGVRARHPGRVRGAVLGRRRDRARAGRQLAGRGRGGGQRDARADRGVVPADVRHSGRGETGRVLLLRTRRGQRRRRDQDPRDLRRRGGRVGAERGEDLGHQRRHRRRARGGGVGGPGPRVARAGELHRAARHARSFHGTEVPQARHQGLAHRRGRAVRRPGARPVRGRRPGAAGGAAGAGPRGRPRRRAGRDEDVRGVAARRGGDGRRRGASGGRSTRPSTHAPEFSSVVRSGRTRRSPSCSRTCGPRSTRPAC